MRNKKIGLGQLTAFIAVQVIFLGFAMTRSFAEVFVYEPFDYTAGTPFPPNENPTALNGGSGFSNAWITLINQAGSEVDAGSLAYPDLVTNGNALQFYADGGAYRETSAVPTSGETWISYLLMLPEGAEVVPTDIWGDDGRPFAFEVYFGFAGEELALGVYADEGGDLFFGLSMGEGFGAVLSDVAFEAGETYLLVSSISWNASGAESINFYVNPDLNAPLSAPDATLESTITSVARVQLSAPNGDGVEPTWSWYVDEIRIGDTFADVAPTAIPEPGVIGLTTLGLFSLVWRLLRKKPALI